MLRFVGWLQSARRDGRGGHAPGRGEEMPGALPVRLRTGQWHIILVIERGKGPHRHFGSTLVADNKCAATNAGKHLQDAMPACVGASSLVEFGSAVALDWFALRS